MHTGDLMERREELLELIDGLLKKIETGEYLDAAEIESVDFKEEAGRRGRNGELQPGDKQNNEAAVKLADEVCCMANTPGGGALILGIDDRTRQVLGTELDVDWLRHYIWTKVDIAPAVEERQVSGQRVLLILVAESAEPVEDTSNRIRWRVGEHCVPVDRSEWWRHRQRTGGYDEMARVTTSTVDDAAPGALAVAREAVLNDSADDQPRDISNLDLLKLIGACGVEGNLTQAARLLFCPANKPLITLTSMNVHGGDITNFVEGDPSRSLLEQLNDIETRLDSLNRSTVLPEGFTERRIRNVPVRAVREAVLNGLIHRDWQSALPTEVTWIDFDSTLIVKSPGGFTGGIDESNLLSNRHARYPALADLFRALRMVDKQGVGVDRMYQSMIVLGHRPPHITETVGPHVTCTLIGGKPVVPIMQMVSAIRPEARQSDYRIAIILDGLLHQPFLSMNYAMQKLQADGLTTEVALRAATSSTIGAEPMVHQYKDVWVLGGGARRLAKRARDDIHAPKFLRHATTDRDIARTVVDAWLLSHEAITSGDLVEMTGMSRPTANQVLNEFDGSSLKRSGSGRSVRYLPYTT